MPAIAFVPDSTLGERLLQHAERGDNGCLIWSVGSRNSQTHLTEEDVRAIRDRRAGGAMLREISQDFGISVATASEICSRRTWQHVA